MTQRGTVASEGSKITVGLLMAITVGVVAITGGVYTLWRGSIDAAASEAAWRAQVDAHQADCIIRLRELNERCDSIDTRLGKIEQRTEAYESWPKASK